MTTTTTRVYFAVPDYYTIGKEFDTYAEAVEYARSTIKPHNGIPGYSRAFVDVRAVTRRYDENGTFTGGTDEPVHQTEVFRIEDEPA